MWAFYNDSYWLYRIDTPSISRSKAIRPFIIPNTSYQPYLFRTLKIKSFALALPWQSLPIAKPSTERLARTVSLLVKISQSLWIKTSFACFYDGSGDSGEDRVLFCYNWWVKTSFACFCDGSGDSGEDRALFCYNWVKTNFACFPTKPCFFRALKIMSFASAKLSFIGNPSIAKPTTNAHNMHHFWESS